MKNVLLKLKIAMVAAFSTIAMFAVAPAASAQAVATYDNDSGGCHNSCLSTMNGGTVSLELLGMNFGEAVAGAEAEGDNTETAAGVMKIGTLNLEGGIFGSNNGCEVDCGSFGAWFSADGSENVHSEAGALATGSNSALAAVGNASQAGLGFIGSISFGTTPASTGND